jgi:Rhodopirellula transposase DDE domain
LGEGPAPAPRIRQQGGGRKRRSEEDPGLRQALERLLLGDGSGRTSHFSWTCDSTTRLAMALAARGHTVSPRIVGRLLRGFGYRLDKHRPSSRRSGDQTRPDQFKQIAAMLDASLERGQPVITVTARSETLLGSEYSIDRAAGQAAGRARSVDSHEMLPRVLQLRSSPAGGRRPGGRASRAPRTCYSWWTLAGAILGVGAPGGAYSRCYRPDSGSRSRFAIFRPESRGGERFKPGSAQRHSGAAAGGRRPGTRSLLAS